MPVNMRHPTLCLFVAAMIVSALFLLLAVHVRVNMPSKVYDGLPKNSEFELWNSMYMENESLTPSFTRDNLSKSVDEIVLNFNGDDAMKIDQINFKTDKDPENLTYTTNILSDYLYENLKASAEYYTSAEDEQFSVKNANSDSKLGKSTTMGNISYESKDNFSLPAYSRINNSTLDSELIEIKIGNDLQSGVSKTINNISETIDEGLSNIEEKYVSFVADHVIEMNVDSYSKQQLTHGATSSSAMQEDVLASLERVITLEDEIFAENEYFKDEEHRTLKKDKPSNVEDRDLLSSIEVDIVVDDETLSAMDIDWQQLFASPDKLNVAELERLRYSVENYISEHAEQSGALSVDHDTEHRIVRRDAKSELLQEDDSEESRSLPIPQKLNGYNFEEIGTCLKALTNISVECHIHCGDTESFRKLLKSFEFCFYKFAGLCNGGTYCGHSSISLDVTVTPSISDALIGSKTSKENPLTQDNVNCLTGYIAMSLREGNISICRSLDKCGLEKESQCDLRLSKPYSILENSCVWSAEVGGVTPCPVKTDEGGWSIQKIQVIVITSLLFGCICCCIQCFGCCLRCIQIRRATAAAAAADDDDSPIELRNINSNSPSTTAPYPEPVQDILENIPNEVPIPAFPTSATSCTDLGESSATFKFPGDSAVPFPVPKIPSVEDNYECSSSYISTESLCNLCQHPLSAHTGSLDSMNTQEMLGDEIIGDASPTLRSSQENFRNQNLNLSAPFGYCYLVPAMPVPNIPNSEISNASLTGINKSDMFTSPVYFLVYSNSKADNFTENSKPLLTQTSDEINEVLVGRNETDGSSNSNDTNPTEPSSEMRV